MFTNFLKHIDIDPQNAHILDGNAKNPVEECNEYEEKIKQAGGVELFIGGAKALRLKRKTTTLLYGKRSEKLSH